MDKSIEEKKLYLEEHFYYEVMMMLFSYKKSENSKYITTDFREDNLAIEGFLLHVRGLIEFFFYSAVKKDARAYEFVENWNDIQPKIKDEMILIKDRIDKELAHLTWGRKDPNNPDKNWDLDSIYIKMLKTLKVFIENLGDNLKGKNMRALVSYLALHQLTAG